MQTSINNATLEVTVGDITQQDTDCIVNAANERLAPGGGVAGAIHRAAGPELWEECQKLGGCKTAEAKITSGHNLAAPRIIHTVGPVYSRSSDPSRELGECYRQSLQLAEQYSLKSIAFPALSTGAFGYPIEEAAAIALKSVADYLRDAETLTLVRFVLFDKATCDKHVHVLQQLGLA